MGCFYCVVWRDSCVCLVFCDVVVLFFWLGLLVDGLLVCGGWFWDVFWWLCILFYLVVIFCLVWYWGCWFCWDYVGRYWWWCGLFVLWVVWWNVLVDVISVLFVIDVCWYRDCVFLLFRLVGIGLLVVVCYVLFGV